MGSETRTLRIVVEDVTKENPVPEKAVMWLRGYGDIWVYHNAAKYEYDVSIGVHEADICIWPGHIHREHHGHTFRFELQPVAAEHKVGGAAYLAMGTIYVEWFDDAIRVHGVPLGTKVLGFDRDDRPKDVIDFESLEKRVAALERMGHYSGQEGRGR